MGGIKGEGVGIPASGRIGAGQAMVMGAGKTGTMAAASGPGGCPIAG